MKSSRFSLTSVLVALAALLPSSHSLSSTDFPRDGDLEQSGYNPNHPFDPAALSSLRLNWSATFNTAELFYAKPLVFTPRGASYERIYTASSQNWIRVLDGMTGAVLASRQLDAPFASTDSQCGDIPNTIGVVGTPVIDPDTEIMYFWSKSYRDGKAGPQGWAKGKWLLYGVKTSDLTNVPGFPIDLAGTHANNDPSRYMIPGTLNQRPGLVMVGNTIVSAFGSHCMQYNYTGFLVTASKSAGVGITDVQATCGRPGIANPSDDVDQSRSGRSGIWQGGNPVALDLPNNRLFFVTANGQSPGELGGERGPARSGKTTMSTLMNAVASYSINGATGQLTQQDWFVPTNYDKLNGADRDLGSSGVTLLDPAVFSGGGVNRIITCAGKNGTIYVMDADNLGGFKNGPEEGNDVLQLIWPDGASFFSGVASYPLEGGYIYFVPTSDSIYAYKFGLKDGRPWFTYAGKTEMTFAGRGAPRVTSNNGQPGTGVVWLTDINQGLQAFKAVPENGVLVPLTTPNTGRLTKFHRPSFGNGRIYTTQNNKIVAVGGPNSPPVNPPGSSSSSSVQSSSTTTSSQTTTSATTTTTTTTRVSSSSSSSSVSSSSSSVSSSISSSVTTTQTTTSTTRVTSVSATTTSTFVTSTRTTTTAGPTPSGAFAYAGCYAEKSSGRALPMLFANDSVTPELCEAYVKSLAAKVTPTVLPYYYVQYARECYGGSSFDWQSSSVTSLSGTKDCTLVCSGSSGAATTGTAMCGGRKQFNLYVTGGTENLPDYWPGVTRTSSSSSSSTANSSVSSSATTTTTTSSVQTTTTSVTTSATSSQTSSSVGPSSSSSSSVATSATTTTSRSATGTSSTPAAYSTPAPPSGRRVSVNWDLTWVNAAPDGFNRPLIAVNGQWPNPALTLNYGDILVLTVTNKLGNESTSVHFHGIEQRETAYADGPTAVTQCPIPPNESFVYQFKAQQVGTFWYHSHHAGQYIDGLRGPLIINNPAPPHEKVDQEHVLTLTDHYHQEAPYLIHSYQSLESGDNGGPEPVPDSALMNGAQNVKFALTPGKTNLFRIINMGAMAGFYVQFDQHTMTIVEIDGQYVQPFEVSQLFISVAQRYSVIVKSKADRNQNFAIVATMAPRMFDINNPPANPTVTGWFVYDTARDLPAPFTIAAKPFDDSRLVPLDQQPLLANPTKSLSMVADFGTDLNGLPRHYLNGASYVDQKVPTLYSVLTAPAEHLTNPAIYGSGANPYILPFGAVVEINIMNHDDRAHPFHLHGHAFQVVARSDNGFLWPGLYEEPATPMKRDTVTVYAQGTATIRFVADNPGVQLFHCHTEWHVVGGMTVTFIEAPAELVASKPYIPGSHRTVCDNYGISRKGNAAGNSKNWLDLTGAHTSASTNNWGALNNPPAA